MATDKQKEFFNELLSQREFPPTKPDGSPAPNPDELRAQFAAVSDKSASAWIEKALELPEKGETAPPF